MARLLAFTRSVPDFRRHEKGNLRHRLSDMLILMILGRASGHIGRADIIEFGRHNLKKFRKMGMLRNGVPSEPTLCRIENGIDDVAMADRMQDFIDTLFSIWRGLRKKKVDKSKGLTMMMRQISMSFTKLLGFLRQK